MASVTLRRRIRARPAIVFDAFSTAQGLTSWWGPDDQPVIAAQADARVGGAFRVRFRTSDGREHECAGEFLEIVAPVRIVMSWRWTEGGEPRERGRTSRVELHLRPIDDGTELTLIHADLGDDSSAHGHALGWEGALDKLARTYTTQGRGT